MNPDTPLLEVENVQMHFPVRGGIFRTAKKICKAVDGVSFSLNEGESFGLVGESGCGKSTLGKCIVGLNHATGGSIRFQGKHIRHLSRKERIAFHRNIAMIFQDPADSLNPRLSIRDILMEPFIVHNIGTRTERESWAASLLERVGLPTDAINKFPFEFSGGQRQRICIARAIALKPKLIVRDEPVSALDVSVQSQVLNLLMDLQKEMKLSYLFIAHDLAVVKHFSDRIAIMYLGNIVELGSSQTIFSAPLHAYTQALISAIPQADPQNKRQRIILRGDVPSPIDRPPGCPFAYRSWLPSSDEEKKQPGIFKEVAPGHFVELHPATVHDYKRYL